MSMTIQEIKNFISNEFSTVSVIEPNDVNRSVTNAIMKWNRYEGQMKTVEKNYNKTIDLSGDVEKKIKRIIRVIPNKDSLLSLVEGRFSEQLDRTTLRGILGSGPLLGKSDPRNVIVNFVQQRDLWETMQQFFGDEPAWTLEGTTLYLDNFPNEVQRVTIKMLVEIPDKDPYVVDNSSAEDFIIDYSTAKLMERQGRLFAMDPEVEAGGETLMNRGQQKQDELEQKLEDSRSLIR